jgi:hypothetical protein
MTTTPAPKTLDKWWGTKWYKEWENLAKKNYHQTRQSNKWMCYFNDENQLIYLYVDI